MRPNLFLSCLGAVWLCALATAQSPDQRPSGLRDAGVITRAAPTITPGVAAVHNSAPAAPVNFPVAPTAPSTASAGALSDRAWTSSAAQPSAQSSASRRLADPSEQPAAPSQVIPAQYTTSQPANPLANTTANTIANATVHPTVNSGANPAAAHEPRPLKPPTAAESKAGSKGSTGTVQMFISVLSSLAIVIGLILASAWFYRKAAPTMTGALPKQVVQVLGRTPLAPRQQLVLLRLGAKLVLVSNLHGEVRTISEIDDPLEVDRLAGLCEAAQPGSISESFRSVLHNIGRN